MDTAVKLSQEITSDESASIEEVNVNLVADTKTLRKLLRVWLGQTTQLMTDHKKEATRLAGIHWKLGVPIIMLGGISIIIGILTFNNDCIGYNCLSTYIRILSILCNALVTVLTGLMVFFNLSKRVSKHKRSADGYSSLARLINTVLACKEITIEVVNDIRSQFDQISRKAPDIGYNHELMIEEEDEDPSRPNSFVINRNLAKKLDEARNNPFVNYQLERLNAV